MARTKTPKTDEGKELKEQAPVEQATEQVEEQTEQVTQEPTVTEDVDLDQELAEIPTTHGTGIQAYMRDKIKAATPER